jgi:peptidoglycan hydrolase-like protein with peptidoglycan-binding domain/Flp pilus assembly protein TadD
MSRSRWALTEGCTPVSAVMRAAGKRARLESRSGLGCLLVAVLSITRLLWVVAASATVLAFAPPLARAEGSLYAQLPTPPRSHNPHIAKAKVAHGRALHRQPPTSATRAARSRTTTNVVLAFGSGYHQPGGSPLVRSLQQRLAVAGFRPGPIDGLYGPRTEAAVAHFQAATGLSIDGIAGPRTLTELSSPTPTVRPGAGYGSHGSRLVRELQRLLARAGYKPHGIDGLYGPHTGQAVRRFQAAHSIRVDGIADPQTLIALRRQAHAKQRSRPATHRPTPRPTTTPPTSVRPRTVAPKAAHAPAPTTGRRTRPPSGTPSVVWLGLIAVAIGVALLLATPVYTRRRRGPRLSSAPELLAATGEPLAPVHGNGAAIAEPGNGHAPETVAGSAPERLVGAGDDGDEVENAFRLGVLLEEQHDLAGAEASYRKADLRGHAAAASNLGVLLEWRGDVDAAEAAYRRADERGDPNGAFNLAVLLEEQDQLAEAEAAYRRADLQAHAAAASNLGVLLERRGDREGAQAAYRRADERGDATGAFNLGLLLEEQDDLLAAEAAYRRADRRGPAEVANAARAALVGLRGDPSGSQLRNGGDLDAE